MNLPQEVIIIEYTIKKLACLAGVSTRTLRYYDEIGLLHPARTNSSGYRIYGSLEIDKLQQILFYREMGIELSEINQIINNPAFNHLAALREHLISLKQQQKKINQLISTVNKTILKEEGKITMSDNEKFEGLKQKRVETNEQMYGEEIRSRYGEEVVERSNKQFLNMSEEDYTQMEALSAEIISRLTAAVNGGIEPGSKEGLAIAGLHKKWLSFTWTKYSKEAHLGLVKMYLDDERFTAYYDKEVSGCAEFLSDAVNAYLK